MTLTLENFTTELCKFFSFENITFCIDEFSWFIDYLAKSSQNPAKFYFEELLFRIISKNNAVKKSIPHNQWKPIVCKGGAGTV